MLLNNLLQYSASRLRELYVDIMKNGTAALRCGRSDSSGERRSYCLHVPVFNLSGDLKENS